jgi:sulfite exporter TauE/SafE
VSDGVGLLGALGIGLFGGVHCVAMCGGIAGAVALGAGPGATAGSRLRLLATVGMGRVLGYALAGVLAGGLGLGVAGVLGAHGGAALRVLAGLLLLGMACVVGGVWRVPLALERVGLAVWRRLAPLAGTLRGAGGARAILLGVLWGWLPCGLVYGALGWAATTGRPLDGALVMTAFGLGTLPATLVTGTAAARLGRVLRASASRRVAGALLAVFALWTLGAGVVMAGRAGSQGACHAPAS